MPRNRWRQVIVRYLIWLPPVVLLSVSAVCPYIPTGDHRSGTWRDPRLYLFLAGNYYLSGLLLFWLVRRLIREHKTAVHKNRRSKGQCAACGYDIRATPQRCPECGMIPDEVKA